MRGGVLWGTVCDLEIGDLLGKIAWSWSRCHEKICKCHERPNSLKICERKFYNELFLGILIGRKF